MAKLKLPMLPRTAAGNLSILALGLAVVNGIGNFGLALLEQAMPFALPALGLVLGFVAIKKNERLGFGIGAILVAAGSGGLAFLPVIGEMASAILSSVSTVALTTALVVGLQLVWEKYRR